MAYDKSRTERIIDTLKVGGFTFEELDEIIKQCEKMQNKED